MKKISLCLVSIIFVLSFVVACSSTQQSIKYTIDTNLVVKIAVAEVMYRNPAWKNEANKISNLILAYNDGTNDIGFVDLENKARSEIEKLDTSPGTKVLAQELVTAISAGIQADLKQKGIVDEKIKLAKTIEFIRWFEIATRS